MPSGDGPYRHYLGGEWTDGEGAGTLGSTDPATGETLGTFRRGTGADVDRAIEAARGAFPAWRELSHIDRAEYLREIYRELQDRHEELGRSSPGSAARR